jgi:hypothetical protein
MNELPIRIELLAAPGVAIQDGTAWEDNGAVPDPIVAALAQLVRDAYANEQRMRSRLRVVGSPDDEAESPPTDAENDVEESTGTIGPERRKSA